MPGLGVGRGLVAFAALTLLLQARATAQAWVPAKGEGTASLTVQDSFIKDHLRSNGERVDGGHIRAFVLVQDIDYGVTDKLAVNVSVPFVLSKYYGPRPHQLPIDNGNYHGDFQDFQLNVRYNLRAHPLMITPFVAIGVPTNDYTYFAHSAAGNRLRQYVFGSNFGRGLAPLLPRAYVQGQYAFVIPEEVQGLRPYRSRIGWEFGYFLTKRFAVRMLGDLQVGHSGLGFPEDFPPPRRATDPNWSHHDQTTKISYLNVGGGASFAVTKSVSAFAALTHTVWGQNGHALSLSEVFGLSWSFRTPWARRQVAPADAATPDRE